MRPSALAFSVALVLLAAPTARAQALVDDDAEAHAASPAADDGTGVVDSEIRGHVVSVERFRARVELDRDVTLAEGAHLAIEMPDDGFCPHRIEGEFRCELVGRVREQDGRSVVVQLGFGENPRVGAAVAATDDGTTDDRFGPPRLGGYFEGALSLGLAGTLNLAGLALGAEGFIGYRGVRPVFARLELGPTGWLLARGPNESFGSLLVIVGLDSRLFSLGIGFGVARHATQRDGVDPIAGALATPVLMRFGAYDGLHIAARLEFVSRDAASEFAGFELVLQTPTRRGSFITARWSYSRIGIYRAEAGYRRLVRGDGGPGSHFVRVSGGAQAFHLRDTPSRQAMLLDVGGGFGGSFGWEIRFR